MACRTCGAPRSRPARLDPDGTAKPLTEIVAVMPNTDGFEPGPSPRPSEAVADATPVDGPAIETNRGDPSGEVIGSCSCCGDERDERHTWRECAEGLSKRVDQLGDLVHDPEHARLVLAVTKDEVDLDKATSTSVDVAVAAIDVLFTSYESSLDMGHSMAGKQEVVFDEGRVRAATEIREAVVKALREAQTTDLRPCAVCQKNLRLICEKCNTEYLETELARERARVAELEAELAEAHVGFRFANERAAAASGPIPMVLHCPECKTRHVDEGDFATRAHHTHSCQECGLTWRPAVVHTTGVRFLPGVKNDAGRSDLVPSTPDGLRSEISWFCDANDIDPENIDALAQLFAELTGWAPEHGRRFFRKQAQR